ncbi:MAG: NAD(P)-dependent alcohol dehydrogenase [Spirochaetota bacterium]
MQRPTTYQIRVRGHLGDELARRFDGFTVSSEPNGETVLTGSGLDQAALHAVIKRVQALGLELVSVNDIGGRRMKAAIHTRYGGPEVVSVRTVDAPVPARGEVLVRVAAASLNAADLLAISGTPVFVRFGSGLFRPRNTTPGTDVAGTVEALGADVTELAVGDRVAGDLSPTGRGAFAELAVTRPEVLARLPDGVSAEDAAALPMAAVTAYQALVDTARVEAGERVLIDGASGGVGTFAVQIAKARGAHVTAICSESKAEIAREAGADVVLARGVTIGDGTGDDVLFDVIYAVNGRYSLREYDAVLAPRGRFVMTGGSGGLAGQVMLQGRRREKQTGRPHTFVQMRPNAADLAAVLEMARAGQIRPVIDRRLTLDEITSGLDYLKAGKARGKVVVTITPSADAESHVERSNS